MLILKATFFIGLAACFAFICLVFHLTSNYFEFGIDGLTLTSHIGLESSVVANILATIVIAIGIFWNRQALRTKLKYYWSIASLREPQTKE